METSQRIQNPNQRLRIKEAIVVEGKDDAAKIKNVCDANIIITHGYGISKSTWEELKTAYNRQGLIILTDPDYAGKNIRRKLLHEFPMAKQAYVPLKEATKDNDVGVENVDESIIRNVLQKAHAEINQKESNLNIDSLYSVGLLGSSKSVELRVKLCDELGIGYCNSKALLKKLQVLGFSNNDLLQMVSKLK